MHKRYELVELDLCPGSLVQLLNHEGQLDDAEQEEHRRQSGHQKAPTKPDLGRS